MRRRLFALAVGLGLLLVADLVAGRLVPVVADDTPVFPRLPEGPPFGPAGRDLVRPFFQGAEAIPPFREVPEPGVPRVMVFGESSIHGGVVGIGFEAEIPARLIAKVSAFAGLTEVLNLGQPGVDLEGILGIAREARRFDPDVVVLYTGHNDVGNLAMRAAWPRPPTPGGRAARDRLGRVGLYRALRLGVSWARGPGGRLVTPEAVAAGEAAFARNLAAFVALWKEAGVDLVLATPVSSWGTWEGSTADCPGALDAWRMDRAGRWSLVLDTDPASVDRALATAPDCAEARFLRGRRRLEAGDLAGGLADLRAARDRHPLPLHATGPVVEAIRAEAARSGIALVDVEAALSTDGPPDPALFHDPVHLDEEGMERVAGILAPVIAAALYDRGVVGR